MNFTRGAVYVDNSNVAYGQGLKNLIAAAVDNIPGLSIQTVTTSTKDTYNATLNYKGLIIGVRNIGYEIYIKLGPTEYSRQCTPMTSACTVAFMYSEEGVMSFSLTSINYDVNNSCTLVSIIPIEFKLSDGTTKELFWARVFYLVHGQIGNVPILAGDDPTSISKLIDPDSQIQYSFSIAGRDSNPVTLAKGKSVAVPATFSNSYGEVVSYNIKGSSPIYYIYPGSTNTLKDYYPGAHVVYIGNVPYIGIDWDYFIRT
nr:MAG TPA: hypothetical protein [Bacteriophage sp.]